MTDKELLELAAKAAINAGLPIIQTDAGSQIFKHKSSDSETYGLWNPLTDNYDVFGLAVALGCVVAIMGDFTAVYDYKTEVRVDVPHNMDKHKATRLAITKYAAEIGRNTK
jgi:hypothetical protein